MNWPEPDSCQSRFHFDRWWNPAVEGQATDRAFRIGQKRNVQAVVGSGENGLSEMSTDQLRKVVSLPRQ